MNKRIFEAIRLRAIEYKSNGDDTESAVINQEKFADLIVEECATLVDWILAEGGKTQGDVIREYFGEKK